MLKTVASGNQELGSDCVVLLSGIFLVDGAFPSTGITYRVKNRLQINCNFSLK
jgi:hypothetical protein